MLKSLIKKVKKLHKPKVVKYLPEPDIMVTLKDFGITKEDTEYTMKGLIAVSENKLTISDNGKVVYKEKPEKEVIFPHTKKTQEALSELRKNDTIVEVEIKDTYKEFLFNSEDYNSVKNIFEIAKASGIEIKNDRELFNYAVNRMVPKKRIVKGTKYLGETAFKGSNVYKYKLEYLICYDMDLILGMKLFKTN